MKNEIIIQKLIGHTRKILGYCEGVTYEQFSADSKLVEACVFNLSQMGGIMLKFRGAISTVCATASCTTMKA